MDDSIFFQELEKEKIRNFEREYLANGLENVERGEEFGLLHLLQFLFS